MFTMHWLIELKTRKKTNHMFSWCLWMRCMAGSLDLYEKEEGKETQTSCYHSEPSQRISSSFFASTIFGVHKERATIKDYSKPFSSCLRLILVSPPTHAHILWHPQYHARFKRPQRNKKKGAKNLWPLYYVWEYIYMYIPFFFSLLWLYTVWVLSTVRRRRRRHLATV